MREARAASLAKADMQGPALTIPPQYPSNLFGKGGTDNASLSPMTLFSTFFADHKSLATNSKPLSSSVSGSYGGLGLFNTGSATEVQACNTNSSMDAITNAQTQHLSTSNAKYKSMVPSRLPIPATSAYFTIPPGLSPTSFLDSPVFFNADSVYPSPTTGSLQTTTKREVLRSSVAGLQPVKTEDISFEQQGCIGHLPRLEDGAERPQLVSGPLDDSALGSSIQIFESTSGQKSECLDKVLNLQKTSESAALIPKAVEVVSNRQISGIAPQCITETPARDGYNWKKYGQKQLKGTEFPRSYYKCTHPNCPVKKQVECSHEGEITEIMYKAEHNHPKPPAVRRGSRVEVQSSIHEKKVEASNMISRTESDRLSADLSSLVGGLGGTPEQSFGSPCMEEGDAIDQSKVEVDDKDEQDSKRRRIELNETLSNVPIRTIREPRVIVQTMSDIDILDDGYRWRKYGQKVVKGNCFPRSYYKCTNVGCTVRKHVERSSTDPSSVMTAYEGKHNHNVPVARGAVRETTGASAGPPSFGAHVPMGVSSVQMAVRQPTTNKSQELGSLADTKFNVGNGSDASKASFLSQSDRTCREFASFSKTTDLTMSLDLSMMGRFSVGDTEDPDLGLNFLQPIYQTSPSACVAQGQGLL